MEELLIETRKVRKLLEVLVNPQHAKPVSLGFIDETADNNARRFGIDRLNVSTAMPDPAPHEECICVLQRSQNGAFGIQMPQAHCPERPSE